MNYQVILADNYGNENLLWLGSKDSKLISYLPRKYASEQKISVLPLINQVTLNDQISNLRINNYDYNSSRNLKINYSFPSFDKEENNLFRYRLKVLTKIGQNGQKMLKLFLLTFMKEIIFLRCKL